MKACIIMLAFLSGNIISFAQIPKVSGGTISHFENFASKNVASRNVDVWLPEGYTAKKKYAVLYMHDGKALFDSSIMWNHQEWGVDEVLGKLLDAGQVRDCIVVGIWNTEITRHNDYLPQKPFASLNKPERELILKAKRPGGQPVFSSYRIYSDNYLRFLVQELKPFIDSNFSTLTDRQNTFIAGSSMGGLVSIYAICEYPDVFGGAACLSTHWPGIFSTANNPFPAAMHKYLEKNLPSPQNHKIYFDHGTETLDSMYRPFQNQVDGLMQAKGFSPGNWITKVYEGADHSERSWYSRLAVPLVYLLGRN